MVESTQKLPMPDLSLAETDPEIAQLIEHEKQRQFHGIELIASENFTSKAVMEALGSCLTNKYSEGYPGKRYYGGNEFIDQIESLCQKRALEAFGLDPAVWGVNVQALSGSPANFAVYTALLNPGDRLMGLSLSHGGHLTHGHMTDGKSISASSKYFSSKPYFVNEETGLIDYDGLEAIAEEFRPQMIVCGASGYPRDMDYERFSTIAKKFGAYLMADIAHTSGLIASKCLTSPFQYSDIVTTTTHKSLRGPRAALIFYRKEYEEKINFAVFPALQGGPHNSNIAAIAVQLKEVNTEAFHEYSRKVIKNAQALCEALKAKGEVFITGGTDNHLIMWDVRPHDLTGSKVDKVLDKVHITTNKNSIVGDKSAINPGGVRLGTPAVTTRGYTEEHMEVIADFLLRAVAIAKKIQGQVGKQLKDFLPALETDEEIRALGDEVKAFSSKFSIPGI
eukprot:403343157